ncbi:hypothetical protein SAMN05192544_102844 [Paraburkholderia hospita]|nr:hypothetical protein SAMN05192544_102844 [Paraburkholderia hospita]
MLPVQQAPENTIGGKPTGFSTKTTRRPSSVLGH